MCKKFIYITMLCIALIYSPLSIYAVPLQQIGGTWNEFIAIGNLSQSKRFKYFLQLALRFRTQRPAFRQNLNRFALGVQAGRHISLWLGTDITPERSLTNQNSLETRLWQQLSWAVLTNNSVKITFRSRLVQAQRNIESGIAISLRENLAIEFMHFIGNKMSLIIFDEVFFNLNHPAWVAPNALSQNRAFIGVQFPITHRTFIRTGYLNQVNFNAAVNTMNHILYLALLVKT